MGERHQLDGLACCHGYRVAAGDLDVGEVETPVFSGPLAEPEFLLVRTAGSISGTFRAVPTACVVDVDPTRRRVAIDVDGERIAALPEQLPLRRGARSGGGAS
jgi:hypothetical protein